MRDLARQSVGTTKEDVVRFDAISDDEAVPGQGALRSRGPRVSLTTMSWQSLGEETADGLERNHDGFFSGDEVIGSPIKGIPVIWSQCIYRMN